MLTPVERVLALKSIDLLAQVGPRQIVGLAGLVREIELWQGQVIFTETDPADAIYVVVEGRVRLTAEARTISEVGPGEAFGTWALIDDSERGQRAECIEDGLCVALDRDDFYDFASGDVTLMQALIRVLARRLRAVVAERPEESRVEGEGVKELAVPRGETLPGETGWSGPDPGAETERGSVHGAEQGPAALKSALLDRPLEEMEARQEARESARADEVPPSGSKADPGGD
jgi:Cyclic nucleotide-binding domain